MSICAAARKAVGSTIIVAGEFGGFGYETKSKRVNLKTSEICNERGAGLVFATLEGNSERDKLYTTKKGSRVVLEGRIRKVDQGRFVHVEDARVR